MKHKKIGYYITEFESNEYCNELISRVADFLINEILFVQTYFVVETGKFYIIFYFNKDAVNYIVPGGLPYSSN